MCVGKSVYSAKQRARQLEWDGQTHREDDRDVFVSESAAYVRYAHLISRPKYVFTFFKQF